MKIPLYQKLIPKSIRLTFLKNKIVKSLENRTLNNEEKEVYDYLKANALNVFPYKFIENYKPENIVIEKDLEKDLLYTLWEGKRLYYKNGNRVKKARAYFHGLLFEQDHLSPHRYLTSDFDVRQGDIIVDVGAAEGNFSLSVIDKVKFVYLFEVEKDWIRALEATFEPWKDKVQIVQKYVSDIDNEDCVKLDTFFDKTQIVNFIKADVEGAEAQVINGASETVASQKDLRVAVCTYHRQADAEDLDKLLKTKGFTNHFSEKYMIFHYGNQNVVESPYLRKAILRGVKSN
jgi:Methyltransferase FkbM domain